MSYAIADPLQQLDDLPRQTPPAGPTDGPAEDYREPEAGPSLSEPSLPWQPTPLSSRGRWPMLASLVIHAGVAAAIVQAPWAETGIAPYPTDAISVELALSNVIEQSALQESAEAAASLAPTATQDGDTVEALAGAQAAETVPVETTDDPARAPVEAVQTAAEEFDNVVSGAGPDAEIAPAAAKEPVKETEQQEKPEKKREPQKDRPRTEVSRKAPEKPDKGKDSETRTKGGLAARGKSDRQSAGGRASASAGNMLGYAARVRARVAANKPSSGGRRGTAVVSFGVTSSGGLAYARLSRSSGNPALDQVAVSAVRRAAPFPTPPAGASSRQLAFSVPFNFH